MLRPQQGSKLESVELAVQKAKGETLPRLVQTGESLLFRFSGACFSWHKWPPVGGRGRLARLASLGSLGGEQSAACALLVRALMRASNAR